MTEATANARTGSGEGFSLAAIPLWGQFAAIIISGVLLSLVWDGATRWPEAWTLPMAAWITEFIEWLKSEATIFGIAFKDITRGIGSALEVPVDWAEYLLYRGFKKVGLDLGPLPWVAVAAGVTIFAHWVGGWRLAILCALTMLYLATFNLWNVPSITC